MAFGSARASALQLSGGGKCLVLEAHERGSLLDVIYAAGYLNT